jgi:ribose-phosphate pyrophosphokinase
MAIFFAMPGNEQLASSLAELTSGEAGKLLLKHFPDGETYVRILSDVRGRDVQIACTLARPDAQFLGLAFAADEIRALGARRVGLVVPYLPYMRQDRAFQPGEALTSRLFAQMLQQHFDALVTVDPHLHRYSALDQLYDIPTTVVRSAPLLARWIREHVAKPVVVGPDSESSALAEAIARHAGSTWTVFAKERRGDRSVRMSAPDVNELRDRTAILVDDIVSSGVTLCRAIRILGEAGCERPICMAVHALCTERTARRISAGSTAFLTSNTVPGRSAEFDVAPLIAQTLLSPPAGGEGRKRELTSARQ